MSTSDLVISRTVGACTTITLNSPSTRNALSQDLLAALRAALQSVPQHSRVIVLGHTGSVFSAGLDLKAATHGRVDLSELAGAVEDLWSKPQATIAFVDGAIRAGGIALAASCDLLVVSNETNFAFTEVMIGAVPALVSATVLRRASAARMMEAFLTGRALSAAEAHDLGLVNIIDDNPRSRSADLAERLAAAGPAALAATVKMLRAALAGQQGTLRELQVLSESAFASQEAQEGMRAFLEKRRPRWSD